MSFFSKDYSKMISFGICCVILIVFMCPMHVKGDPQSVDQTPLTATCSPATVAQVFSSIFSIDLLSVLDPEVVFGLTLPAEVAAEINYNETLRLFQTFGFRNAKSLASRLGRAVSLVSEFTLPLFLQNVGIAVGELLAERGVLDCYNVIQRATEYFENEKRFFLTLDPTKYGSYVDALVLGLEELFDQLGFSLEEKEENWQFIVDSFYREYSKYAS